MTIERVRSAVSITLVMATLSGCVARQVHPEPADPGGRVGAPQVAHADEWCRAKRGGQDLPEYPFTSDGCSMWPDDGWAACCVEHDVGYWCGGTHDDRVRADLDLRRCVAAGGTRRHLRDLMYWGVRVGGIPWQPFPWRWAYGYRGIRGYDP